MTYRGLVCLLLGALAWGQAANSSSPAAEPMAQDQTSTAAKPADMVPPDAVVMTIPGVCDTAAGQPAPADCRTTVTRGELESVMKTVAPTMPSAARKQFATRYAMGLVMTQEAHKLGLDKGEKYDEMTKISRMQVLMQLVGDHMRETAGQVSDKDIEDYYNSHKADFEEVNLQRVVIPHSKQMPASKVKLTPAQTKQRQQEADAAMKTEATALQKRAAAGASFDKLQAEAFVAAGMKTKPPSADLGKIRKNNVPAAHAAVWDLKPGAVSELFTDPSGYYVYKVGARDTLTLDQVKEEVQNTLKGQRMQEAMQSIQKMATPTFEDKYFAPQAPPPAPGAPMQSKPPSASSEHQ